jgi:serine/threonine protein kinase
MNTKVQSADKEQHVYPATTTLKACIRQKFRRTHLLKYLQTQPGVSYLCNLRQELGEGGCGTVCRSYKITTKKYKGKTYYQAHWDKPLAAKFSLDSMSEGDDLHNIWKNEASIQAQCYPAVHASGKMKDGRFVIISDLIQGENAWSAWRVDKKVQKLSWRQRSNIAVQIAAQLSKMHNSGIIHADVKLANMLFNTTTAATPTISLFDFGFSIALAISETAPPDKHIKKLYRIERIGGTPGNAAPELLQNKIGCPSDIYALTAALLKLFGATNPFKEKDQYDPHTQLQEMTQTDYNFGGLFKTIKTPKTLTIEKKEEMCALFQKMQSQEPSERPDADTLLKFFLNLQQWSIMEQVDRYKRKLKASLEKYFNRTDTKKLTEFDKKITRQIVALNILNGNHASDTKDSRLIRSWALQMLAKEPPINKRSIYKLTKIASQNLSFSALIELNQSAKMPLATLLRVYLLSNTAGAQAQTNAMIHYVAHYNKTNDPDPVYLCFGEHAHMILVKHKETLTPENKEQLLDIVNDWLPFDDLYKFYNENSSNKMLSVQAKVKIVKKLHDNRPTRLATSKNKKEAKRNKKACRSIRQWASTLLNTAPSINTNNKQTLANIATEDAKPKELTHTYNHTHSKQLKAAVVQKLAKHSVYAPLFPQTKSVKTPWFKVPLIKLAAAIKDAVAFIFNATYRDAKKIAGQEKASLKEISVSPSSPKASSHGTPDIICAINETAPKTNNQKLTPRQPSINTKKEAVPTPLFSPAVNNPPSPKNPLASDIAKIR